MMALDERIRASDDSGATAVWTIVVVSFVVLAILALVTSLGSLYVERRVLQTAAEAGALAGADEWTMTDEWASIEGAATAYVNKNLPVGANAHTVVSTESGYLLRVSITERDYVAPMAGLLGNQAATLTVTAAATAVEPSTAFAPECGLMLESGANPEFTEFNWFDTSENWAAPRRFGGKEQASFDPSEDQLLPVAVSNLRTASTGITPDVAADYYWKLDDKNPPATVPTIRFFDQAVSGDCAFNDPANILKVGGKNTIRVVEVSVGGQFVTKKDPPPDVRNTAFEGIAALLTGGASPEDPGLLLVVPICEWPEWLQSWSPGVAISNADLGSSSPATLFWKTMKAPPGTEEPDTQVEAKKCFTTVAVVGFALMRVSALLDAKGAQCKPGRDGTLDLGHVAGMRATYVRVLTPAEEESVISWRIKTKRPKKHQPPVPVPTPPTEIPYEQVPFSQVHLVP